MPRPVQFPGSLSAALALDQQYQSPGRADFLGAGRHPRPEEPELQLALGASMPRASPQKAITLMHHALSLYGEGTGSTAGSSPPSAPLYMGQKAFDQAYLWGKVSESFQESPEVSLHPARPLSRHRQGAAGAAGRTGRRHRRALEQGSYQAP